MMQVRDENAVLIEAFDKDLDAYDSDARILFRVVYSACAGDKHVVSSACYRIK